MKTAGGGKSQIRKHYFLNRYVIIAPKRDLRPENFATEQTSHKLESPTSPAIEKAKAVLTINNEDGGWAVKVIKNAFPALTIDNPDAYGQQEVIIETPEHNLEFSELSLEQLLRVFKAYRDRLTRLAKLKDIRYVSLFKNDGPAAGASIAHAHSQVVALPLIPPELEEEAEAADLYLNEHGRCPYCDVLDWESKKDVRLIYEDKQMAAITPFASIYSFEVWIIPKRHAGHFNDLTTSELESIAIVLKNLTSKLDSINLSYNFFLQNSLPGRQHHFVLKLEPRRNIWAGLELGTGVILNPVSPEFAAIWYRGKLPK